MTFLGRKVTLGIPNFYQTFMSPVRGSGVELNVPWGYVCGGTLWGHGGLQRGPGEALTISESD